VIRLSKADCRQQKSFLDKCRKNVIMKGKNDSNPFPRHYQAVEKRREEGRMQGARNGAAEA
jgi:hypothetical protein